MSTGARDLRPVDGRPSPRSEGPGTRVLSPFQTRVSVLIGGSARSRNQISAHPDVLILAFDCAD
jgi:hypothetical protein